LAGLAALAVLTVDVARTTRPGAATGDSDAAATGPDLLGALVGALAVQGALRLPATGFHGLPSLVTGIAMLAVAVSGYRHASRPAQRASRWTAAAAAAAVIAAGGALA